MGTWLIISISTATSSNGIIFVVLTIMLLSIFYSDLGIQNSFIYNFPELSYVLVFHL